MADSRGPRVFIPLDRIDDEDFEAFIQRIWQAAVAALRPAEGDEPATNDEGEAHEHD